GLVLEDLLSDLLVQALRDEGIDSRSVSLGPGAQPSQSQEGDLVSTIILSYPLEQVLEPWQAAVRDLRVAFPQAMLVTVKLTSEHLVGHDAVVVGQVDLVVRSYSEAVAFVLAGRVATA